MPTRDPSVYPISLTPVDLSLSPLRTHTLSFLSVLLAVSRFLSFSVNTRTTYTIFRSLFLIHGYLPSRPAFFLYFRISALSIPSPTLPVFLFDSSALAHTPSNFLFLPLSPSSHTIPALLFLATLLSLCPLSLDYPLLPSAHTVHLFFGSAPRTPAQPRPALFSALPSAYTRVSILSLVFIPPLFDCHFVLETLLNTFLCTLPLRGAASIIPPRIDFDRNCIVACSTVSTRFFKRVLCKFRYTEMKSLKGFGDFGGTCRQELRNLKSCKLLNHPISNVVVVFKLVLNYY